MTREEALKLIKEKIRNQNLLKHSLAVEACMGALAERFGEDKEKWILAGLLHDIDYEETQDNPKEHSLKGAQELENIGLEKTIVEAVRTHNETHGLEPADKIGKALFAVDPLTGLIVAATLVLPDKKISSLTTQNVLNRFKEKSFARGANREIIEKCKDVGLSLEEFIELCLFAMKQIADILDL